MEVHGRQPHSAHETRDRVQKHKEKPSDARPTRAHESAKELQDLREKPVSEPKTGAAGARAGSLASPVESTGAAKPPVLHSATRAHDRKEDVVELSDAAGALNEADTARAEKVEDLRRAHEEGSLLTPHRIEQAALGILRG